MVVTTPRRVPAAGRNMVLSTPGRARQVLGWGVWHIFSTMILGT